MKKYEQAQRDYDYLVRHHRSAPSDITSGFVEGRYFMELLRNPSKELAYKHYVELIKYSAGVGFEEDMNRVTSPDFTDKRVVDIYKSYSGCAERVLTYWNVNINELVFTSNDNYKLEADSIRCGIYIDDKYVGFFNVNVNSIADDKKGFKRKLKRKLLAISDDPSDLPLTRESINSALFFEEDLLLAILNKVQFKGDYSEALFSIRSVFAPNRTASKVVIKFQG